MWAFRNSAAVPLDLSSPRRAATSSSRRPRDTRTAGERRVGDGTPIAGRAVRCIARSMPHAAARPDHEWRPLRPLARWLEAGGRPRPATRTGRAPLAATRRRRSPVARPDATPIDRTPARPNRARRWWSRSRAQRATLSRVAGCVPCRRPCRRDNHRASCEAWRSRVAPGVLPSPPASAPSPVRHDGSAYRHDDGPIAHREQRDYVSSTALRTVRERQRPRTGRCRGHIARSRPSAEQAEHSTPYRGDRALDAQPDQSPSSGRSRQAQLESPPRPPQRGGGQALQGQAGTIASSPEIRAQARRTVRPEVA